MQLCDLHHRVYPVPVFPYQIISLFGKGDELYYEFAIHFMRTFLFMVIVNGVQLISSNFFSAIGKPLKGLLLSMTRQVFFLIPLVLILPLFSGSTESSLLDLSQMVSHSLSLLSWFLWR